jgi:uncharacterized protein YjbI with pentapeptide repeats
VGGTLLYGKDEACVEGDLAAENRVHLATDGNKIQLPQAPPPEPEKKKAKGKTLAEFVPLNRAEQMLLKACAMGDLAKIGNSRPRKKLSKKIIRPEFLRFLILGGDDCAPVHERGIRLKGAWISGSLDLTCCKVTAPFHLWSCVIDGKIELTDAQTCSFNLQNSKVRGVLTGGEVQAIDARRLNCGGSVFFIAGFTSLGGVNFVGAYITGDLSCQGGRFRNPAGMALLCDGIQVNNRVFLRRQPSANTRIVHPAFQAYGTVSFIRATVKGGLYCPGGRFERRNGIALNCEGADIGTAGLRNVDVKGTVRFIATRIRGDLNCAGSRFHAPKRMALDCSGATIDGRVFLDAGFDAIGEVRFFAAKIANLFVCRSARLRQECDKRALTCDSAEIGGVLVVRNLRGVAKRKIGILRLLREKGIREVFSILLSPRRHAFIALLLNKRKTGQISFTQARAAALADDLQSWKIASAILLDGYRYDRLVDGLTDARSRKQWLKLQPHSHIREAFRPQPWQQLARVLVEMGHDEDAKQIRIKMRALARRSQWWHRQRWRNVPYWWLRTRFDKLLGILVGYGYRPWRALVALVTIWAIGAVIYGSVQSSGVMAPLDGKMFRNKSVPPECKIDWVTFSGPQLSTAMEIQEEMDPPRKAALQKKISDDEGRRADEAQRSDSSLPPNASWQQICRRVIPPEYSDFHPGLYSADLLVPFLDARQKSNWRVRAASDHTVDLSSKTSVRLPFGKEQKIETQKLLNFLWYWQLAQPVLGWALLLLIAGTVSGLIKKD